jgi:alkyl hydroperoxide reductase subunit AhpC
MQRDLVVILTGPLNVIRRIVILADPTGGFIDEIQQAIKAATRVQDQGSSYRTLWASGRRSLCG